MKQGMKAGLILGAIVAMGLFLRLYQLNSQPYWMDEGYTVNAVISGIQNGTTHLAAILDSGKTYFCPLYCLPTALITQLLDQEPWVYRILAALMGALFIILTYFFAKTVFSDKRVALLSAVLVSFSYWQIAWSRQARWYTLLEVLFWLCLWLFYSFLKAKTHKQKITYLVSSVIAALLAIVAHKLAYLLPVVMFAWYAIDAKPKKKSLLIGGVATLSLIAFAEFVLGLGFIANIAPDIKLQNNFFNYAGFYLRNYWPFLLLITSSVIPSTPLPPKADWCRAGLSVVTPSVILNVARRSEGSPQNDKKTLMLLIPFFIYLIPLSFLSDIVEYRYLFHTTVAFYILSAVAMIGIWDALHHPPCHPRAKSDGDPGIHPILFLFSFLDSRSPSATKNDKEGYIKIVALVALILLLPVLGQLTLWPKAFYFLESDGSDVASYTLRVTRYNAYTPQPDFNRAYAAIKQNLKPDEIVISSHPHFTKIFLNQPGYWIAYDYLGRDKESERYRDQEMANGKENYVGAIVIHDLAELKDLTTKKHGYIVFDYMSADNRIDPAILQYIRENMAGIFFNKINSYSVIWVYGF